MNPKEMTIFAWPKNLKNGLDEVCHQCSSCKPIISGYFVDSLGNHILECEHQESCMDLKKRLVEKYESKRNNE